MNVVGPIKPSSSLIAGIPEEESSSKNAAFKQIQLYDEAPQVEMSLDQFEVYALKRLKVLRKLERVMNSRTANSIDGKNALKKTISEELETPELDQISHFILRAAYSLDEEKRRWFLTHETALFRFRLEQADQKVLTKSCKMFQLTPLHPKEAQEKMQLLKMLLPHDNNTRSSNQTFYKVPFTQALDLVAKRQCIVERGFAYIPASKVVSILAGKFRMLLSASLAHLAQNGILGGSNSSEAERLHPLLQNINSCLLETEPISEELGSFQASMVTPGNVPKLVQHMPLCMRTMQTGLQKDKKLRYHGRLQYGLFLKGAGLSLEDALVFFQRSFSNMTAEQWQKEYSYSIRHTYGKEGQKKSKSAYNCSGIINSQPPSHPGDHHGCPYKEYDSDKLSKLLQSLKIGSTPGDRQAIVNLQKSKHYNLACLEHFKVMHPNQEALKDISVDNIGNHPNAWFRASLAYKEYETGGAGAENNEKEGALVAGSPKAVADVAMSSA
ncbi:primase large subunit [Seminavis robusta]|uniref:Primase large subunit n=1 Tax=Seminavis robusta TaxID=568900 RepID=A0A9N8ER55_9STRA|nr:primase large subunit [Seminavis robusta]|eukprot:Sro1384_g268120.1 primase large subunit (497) ;mRNA; f:19457-21115